MIKKLDKSAATLLIVGILYLAGMTLASTFVNVYLIRLTNDLGLIILQNIANYIALLLAFILGSRLVKKTSISNLFRVGIISTILYYFFILVLKEQASNYLIYLGIFMGIGSGLYYFSFNILIGKLVSEDKQPSFFSFQTTFSYIFGVVAPAISGMVIVNFTKLTGYYVLFGCALVLFIIAIGVLVNLNGVKVETDYHILEALFTKNKYWYTNFYYNLSFGLREAIYAQIFIVFAYRIINNEQTIGNLNSMMSLIGVFSGLLIASKFNLRNLRKYEILAGCLYFIALMSLALFANDLVLIFSYAVLGVVICWNTVIFQLVKYKLASFTKEGTNQSDYIIATEFPMAIGRIIGLIVSLLLNQLIGGELVYRLLLAVISVMIFIDYFVVSKSVNWLEE